jgi:replication factor A1
MSSIPDLTAGAIAHIYNTKDTSAKPVVQVVELKQINSTAGNGSSNPRYRLSVSDGQHFQPAMLATQLNDMVAEGSIDRNTVFRMNDYIANEVSNKRIIIILNVDNLGKAEERIGDPVSVESLTSGVAPAAVAVNVASAAPVPAPPTTGGFTANAPTAGVWNAAPPARDVKLSASGVMSMAARPTPGVGGSGRFRPIQTINPYQSGWTIKGRCTYKSEIRKFQNARGEGSVISFELTDKSGSIRATAFTEQSADIDAKVQIGRVYTLTRGQLKQANEKYNRSTSSFEMTLDRSSVLLEADEDDSVGQIQYNFVKIAALEQVEVKGLCDVVAAVHEVGEISEIIVRSTGEPMKKRSVTLIDDSNATVELTLWRNQAETLLSDADIERHPIMVLRNAMRGDFGGVCLNTSRMTVIELDPTNILEANSLRGWYDAGGSKVGFQSLSGGGGNGGKVLGDRKSMQEAQVEDVHPHISRGSVQFVMRGYVAFMKKDKELSYPSDPETKKKCTQIAQGMWHSESSGRDFSDDEIVHRYICNLKVVDYSGAQWMTAFDEGGQVVLGRTANEMRDMFLNDSAMFESVIDECFFRPMVMKVKVQEQEYQGEAKIRYTVARCENTDYVSESRALMSEIASYAVTT